MTSPGLLLLLCAAASLAHDPTKAPEYRITIHHLRAEGLPRYDFFSKSDAFVKVFLGDALLGETAERKNEHNPWWKESFNCTVINEAELKLEVYDHDDSWAHQLMKTCKTKVDVRSLQKTCLPVEEECELEDDGKLFYAYTLELKK